MIRKSMILTALGVALLATPAFAQSAPSNKSDTDTGVTQSQQMNPAGSVAPASPNNEQSAGAGGINGPRGVSGTSPSKQSERQGRHHPVIVGLSIWTVKGARRRALFLGDQPE